MTAKEAIMQIQAIPEKIWDQLSEPDREAMEMAFSALQVQEAKTQLSAEGTTSDLISRQKAIEAMSESLKRVFPEHRQIAEKCLKALPSVQPEIEERKEESAQNVPKEDLISRKAAIDALGEEPEVWTGNDEYAQGLNHQWRHDVKALKALTSAQPERCEDCANFSKTRLLIPQPEKRTEERTETHACDLIDRQTAKGIM